MSILSRTSPADKGAPAKPMLTPHLRFHVLDGTQTLLLSESFNTLLHGTLYGDLLPLLNGGHSQSEIVGALTGNHEPADVISGMAGLGAKGYLVCGDFSMPAGRAAYWSSLGASPCFVQQRLAEKCVAVPGGNSRMVRHLEQAGIRVGTEQSALEVIVCDDYLDTHLPTVNEAHFASGQPWMLVRPHGMEPLFGPVFSRQGACWQCLVDRMAQHKEVHNFVRLSAGDEAAFRPVCADDAVVDSICGLAAAEVAKWLVLGADAPVHDHAITLNVARLQASHHPVTQRPQCAACGDPELRSGARPLPPLRLVASPKPVSNSGGTRSIAPEATLARYRHLVSPISGVVPWLTRTTDDADDWLHVYWAGSNLAMKSRDLSVLRRSLRSKSAGKGSTRAQSEVSALCEAVERYSGAFHGDERRIRKRFVDFEGGDAVHPNDVQLFSEHQLDNAGNINAQGHPYNIIPKRLETEAEIDWSPVWSMSREGIRYLPTSMLYFGVAPDQDGSGGQIADSNGCAAGNTLAEAIMQGFFELVERDAFALWWYNRLRVPAVDLSSFNDEFMAAAEDYYHRQQRTLWLLDVTSDFRVPAFVALSRRTGGISEDIIYGAGAHSDPKLAALRAICELNQCLTWLPGPASRDGKPMIDDPLALWWWRTARLDDCPWLSPAPDVAPSRAGDFSVPETTDARDDVAGCLALLESKGMELLVLDQTQPDIGMPVVRVMVPGMRHFWQRLAPGRLYNAPVGMGRLPAPLTESQLNTTPVIA